MAEHDLLPAVRQRPDAVVLADGFSCRTQLAELADRQAVTLAAAAVAGLPSAAPGTGRRCLRWRATRTTAPRPPSRPAAQQRATLDQESVDVP